MSKRGQTSGVPKDPQQPAGSAKGSARQQPRLIKEYHTKAEREARIERLLILSMIIVAVVVIGILSVSFIYSQLVVPNQTAATVNGQSISVGEFARDVRLTRALRNFELNAVVSQYQQFGASSDQIQQLLTNSEPYATWLNELQISDQLGNAVLTDMIEARLIRQEAANRGITVTDADVDQQISDFFGYDPVALLSTPTPTTEPTATRTPIVSPTPAPTLTPTVAGTATVTPAVTAVPTSTPQPTLNATELADRFSTVRNDTFSQFRSAAGVSDADLRAYFELQALRKALAENVTGDISREAPFTDSRVIVVDNLDKANDIVAALAAGDSFSELARANSSDTSATTGGALGWRTTAALAGDYGQAAADAVAAAAIGSVVGPIQTDAGTYAIFQIRGREQRELTENQYNDEKSSAFQEFLDGLRAAAVVETTNNWVNNVPNEPAINITGVTG